MRKPMKSVHSEAMVCGTITQNDSVMPEPSVAPNPSSALLSTRKVVFDFRWNAFGEFNAPGPVVIQSA